MFVNPLKLGPIKLASNLIQGPLAGYSCAPFRVITEKYGKPAYCVTEMISAKDLIHRQPKPKRYLGKDSEEGVLCYQLSGDDPSDLSQASEIVSNHGADLIDLNCGCPVNKIRSKQAGSKLLTTPERIFTLVKAIKANTDAVVSIKIRVAGNKGDHNDVAVIDAAEHAGVDFIVVHGRHWTERYDVPCDFDAIASIVKIAKVPIIANGDVEDYDSLKMIFETTNCAGIMIARASVGQPWLFHELSAKDKNQIFEKPTLAFIGNILQEHIERLIALENEKLAILQSRKLAKYYARELKDKKPFILAMQGATTKYEVMNSIRKYFGE